MASSIDLPTYPTSNTDPDDAVHPLAGEELSGDLFSSMISKGVIHGVGNTFQVYADATGMHVKVKTGRATSGGFWGNSEAEEIIDITPAHPSSPRIDSIVLRLDRTSPSTLKLRTVDGAPNLTPLNPTLDADDVYLADVRVDGGVSSIASNKITDKRQFAQPGSNVGNRTEIRGNESAPAHYNTGGTVKWLSGMRADITGNDIDYVLYGYASNSLVRFYSAGTEHFRSSADATYVRNLFIGATGDWGYRGMRTSAYHSETVQIVNTQFSNPAPYIEIGAEDDGGLENFTLRVNVASQWLQVGQSVGMGGAINNVIGISNVGSSLGGNPSSGGYLYAQNGALKWRGSGGTDTVVAPA